ncbi:hypothetical protein M011DRAFT_459463 [Sporormia fimetaria CBS 119925]|uniref:Uncharacterized protein n=1 Tax=Sporormia fimetaria CBS 119925 TaxID=1340428 RepID=A0A6A6V6V0_9PLEO|nr:hypothetical protein M011DRAFT_459463 [Sporormia fimetaria CBS 119925]
MVADLFIPDLPGSAFGVIVVLAIARLALVGHGHQIADAGLLFDSVFTVFLLVVDLELNMSWNPILQSDPVSGVVIVVLIANLVGGTLAKFLDSALVTPPLDAVVPMVRNWSPATFGTTTGNSVCCALVEGPDVPLLSINGLGKVEEAAIGQLNVLRRTFGLLGVRDMQEGAIFELDLLTSCQRGVLGGRSSDGKAGYRREGRAASGHLAKCLNST